MLAYEKIKKEAV